MRIKSRPEFGEGSFTLDWSLPPFKGKRRIEKRKRGYFKIFLTNSAANKFIDYIVSRGHYGRIQPWKVSSFHHQRASYLGFMGLMDIDKTLNRNKWKVTVQQDYTYFVEAKPTPKKTIKFGKTPLLLDGVSDYLPLIDKKDWCLRGDRALSKEGG